MKIADIEGGGKRALGEIESGRRQSPLSASLLAIATPADGIQSPTP